MKCPYCKSTNVFRFNDNIYRCRSCDHTFPKCEYTRDCDGLAVEFVQYYEGGDRIPACKNHADWHYKKHGMEREKAIQPRFPVVILALVILALVIVAFTVPIPHTYYAPICRTPSNPACAEFAHTVTRTLAEWVAEGGW